MSIVALSPVAPEPASPMVTSVTPTLDPEMSTATAAIMTASFSSDLVNQHQDGVASLGPAPSQGRDPSHRSKKPPPLHTGADWKVILHLPEIETWLRSTSDRVTQLTHSVGQDTDNRHVDVHLVQLKDVCEDISDHVEQIHALLETEFSLKLLSYSVNIIVDIRTVQLLWHQLRVSVLVLKERLLQGLQDSNGNYTRQTDILQAFSQDQHQTRLDALTEVDDCGQLTIRCSQDYFSLDCGITAFELSDYSPGEEPEALGPGEGPKQEEDPDPAPNHNKNRAELLHSADLQSSTSGDSLSHAPSPSMVPTMQCSTSNLSEGSMSKRPLQGGSHSGEVSPTQPSLPKRAAMFSEGGAVAGKVRPASGLQFQAELSWSSPSLLDPPDRSRFWLELNAVYPENVSQSCESLQVMNMRNLQRSRESSREAGHTERSVHRMPPDHAAATLPRQAVASQNKTPKQVEKAQGGSKGESDSSLPSSVREQLVSSDQEASGEDSDSRPPSSTPAVWIVKRQEQKVSGSDREHWYGSEEFLALPAQLRNTEMLAVKLENLAQVVSLRPGGGEFTQEALQDVDDWDLTELNPDWDTGESGDDVPSPLPPLLPYRQNHFLVSRFSSSSSSDIAPSLDESIESGPLSDLQSEEDERLRSANCRPQLTAPLVAGRGAASLIQQLHEDVQSQDKDPDVWRKMEHFVQQLDGFISWLQEALDSTENWTQPKQELDSLRAYLDTHLSFKLNVDSHGALKESIMEDGRVLLSVITSHKSGLKDILLMVSSQWDQLQRQIRRQHGWMLHALRCIQARLFHAGQSHEPAPTSGDPPANQQGPADGLKAECDALQQMAVKLSSLHYQTPTNRRRYSQLARNNSVQEFEAEYQELWDWLMDMDAMVTDSQQLMMSDEQRCHLFKSSHVELMVMESRKTCLLGRAESLKRSGAQLPSDFHRKIHNLTHTWRQLEKILSEHAGTSSSSSHLNQQHHFSSGGVNSLLGGGVSAENPRSALSPLTTSLLEQLEARIKELKAWLRDTELLIFNSCLRHDKDASAQVLSFKTLCTEIRARRRGVSSVLRLCQKLLQQSQSGPTAEVGPEAEQHREALQLLSINLERRWEAIVMQALQWQNRLRRELEEPQVPGNFLEPGLVDLHQISPIPAGPAAPAPDDSWEWDETDMTITEPEPRDVTKPDLTSNLPTRPDPPPERSLSNGNPADWIQTSEVAANQHCEILSNRREAASSENDENVPQPSSQSPQQQRSNNNNNNNVFQVFSLHDVQLYKQPSFPVHRSTSCSPLKSKAGRRKQQLLLKSLSKDSSFSSIESLPDLLGGLVPNGRGGGGGGIGERMVGYDRESEREGSRGSSESASSRRSESESGIVSDTGEPEITTNSEIQGEDEDDDGEEEEAEARRDPESCPQNNQINDGKREEKGRRRDENGGEIRRNREKRKKQRRGGGGGGGGGEAVEILINGSGILTPADSDSDVEVGDFSSDIMEFRIDQCHGLDMPPRLRCRASPPMFSQSFSSLESLLAPGVELFPSKDALLCSASLESCLAPCRSAGGENGGSLASLGELSLGGGRETEAHEPGMRKNEEGGAASSEELSRRTLDLLKRLENIQSPLAAKMTRSVSDMTLRSSSSPQRSRLPASPSLGGRHVPLSGVSCSLRRGPPSLINESSATASLTELSSTEDSSAGSEDFATLRNQRHLFLDPTTAANANTCYIRKRCHGNSRGGQVLDESDAASLSMVVNVSCTSACTDEDEDDSDLLSSSTLTLTEEELGVRDGEDEDEEQLSGASSGNEEAEDEEEMEGCYVLELQSWIRPLRTSLSSSSKTEAGLRDELQCGSNLSFSSSSSSTFTSSSSQNKEQRCFLNASTAERMETRGGGDKAKWDEKEQEEEEEEEEEEEKNRMHATRSYMNRFVDDMENGNVDRSSLRGKDEDDELLREESSVFTKRGEFYGFSLQEVESSTTTSVPPDLLPFPSKRTSSLVGQLRGELPCHSFSLPSPPSLSPVDDCRSHDALHGGRKSITIQEKFKFSSLVTEESRRQVRDKDSFLPPKKRHGPSSCCLHLPSSSSSSSLHPCHTEEKQNTRDFVMEIIDMTSLALKSKENQDEELNQDENAGSTADPNPGTLAHIRDKVLELSHRPLRLRKGDFYSYLSLSSHDSDCGEVSQCSEDKSATPAPYAIPYASPSPVLFTSSAQRAPSSAPPNHATPAGVQSAAHSPMEEPASPALPPSPDIRDEETLFPVCTEQVYLGPPLCYSMALNKPPRFGLKPGESFDCLCLSEGFDFLSQEESSSVPDENLRLLHPCKESSTDVARDSPYVHVTTSSFSPFLQPYDSSSTTSSPSKSASSFLHGRSSDPPPLSSAAEEEEGGEDLYLLCDVAGGEVTAALSVGVRQEERSCNEGPPYLNPRARVTPIDSSAAPCLADTKTLESNMGAVMTKISVCSAATNPSKEPAAAAAQINPKINRSPMREADRGEEEERREEADARLVKQKREEKRRRERVVSQQEVAAAKQVTKASQSAVHHVGRNAQGRSQASERSPTLRTVRRVAGTSRISL